MNKTLPWATDFALPLEIATERSAFLGRPGSGKTYAALRLAELLWDVGAQFVILDPVGKCYALRLGRDGSSKGGIPIPVFGGLHGDVPLEPTGGALLADVIIDRGISAVIDVSQFESDADKARFAEGFMRRFYFRKKASPSAVLLILEECQEFVPQNPGEREKQMLHEYVRAVKLGRNYGIGVCMLSQRPQEVNKKALNLSELLVCFQLVGSHERKAVEQWMKDKDIELDVAAMLPKLQTGRPHIWSPGWLQVSRVVQVSLRRTYDASATPKVGADAVKAQPLTPVDVANLEAAMAASSEKAKAEDPKELQREIARLRRDLATAQKAKPAAAPAAAPKVQKVNVLKDGQLARAERLRDAIQASVEKAHQTTAQLNGAIIEIGKAISLTQATPPDPFRAARQLERQLPRASGSERGRAMAVSRLVAAKAEVTAQRSGDLTGPEQRIVDSLAWWETIGITTPENSAVAFKARYSPTSTSYTNPRSALSSRGLISYPSPDRVALTEAGRALANAPASEPTTEQLHQEVMQLLSGPERRIMSPLLEAYPRGLSNEEAASAAGYSPTSTSYTNPRSHLSSIGLIEYPTNGYVRARSTLFLEGANA